MGTSKGKRYKCPYCEYRDYRPELIDHVEEDHQDMIPKDYTPSRIVYNSINKKDHGTCMICHKETKWDETKQRYDSLCGSQKCKKEYVEIVRSRMVKKHGTYNLLKDPNFQKKMLENRSISGKYKFEDGGSVGYVGSYEKKFLEFMDQFLHIKSYDIISPGPHIPYKYKGKEHVWITDFIYEPYNLVFDIKDGGDNPNTRDMKEYREKQIAKEKAIAEYGDYNYIRLTNNNFEQLISIFMELKEKVDEKPLIRINESYIEESKNKSTVNRNFKKKSGIEFIIYDIHDPKALKYMKKYPKWSKDIDYIKSNCRGEIAIDPITQKIIGQILIKEKEFGIGITGFHVNKDYRGYGLGDKLFQDAVNKYNGEILGVYADNKVAIRLYEKYGFKTIDTKTDDDGKYYIMKRDNLHESYIEESDISREVQILGEFVIIQEEAMTSKERNDLDDDDFGIPELRKYPLHDKKHVEQAIKMFNHVEKKYESELADNLLDAMEKYHISTDVVGDKNRLKKYIKEETTYISEGLIWNDNTPEDIKKLKEDIKEALKMEIKKDAPDDVKDVMDKAKSASLNKFMQDEKKDITSICNKCGVKIKSYIITTTSYNGASANTHNIIGIFKDYILSVKFMGVGGNVTFGFVNIAYDNKKCNIPKNVAFDLLNMMSSNIDKVKSTKHSIKVSGLSNNVDSAYPRLSHKYSNKYNVKKNIGGFSITISTLKSTNENAIAGAMPRQDYQPDAVYIINYLKKNTFVSDLAICKDKMSNIFICDNGKPFNISLSEFRDMIVECKVYKCIYDSSFDHAVKLSKSGLDFYKNTVNDASVTMESLKTDYRFEQVPSYIDELNSIEECVINSAPKSGIINEVYCPIIPLVNENVDDSSVHFFRDIDGVFAQNIDTLHRSASYKSLLDIPETTINLLKNI